MIRSLLGGSVFTLFILVSWIVGFHGGIIAEGEHWVARVLLGMLATLFWGFVVFLLALGSYAIGGALEGALKPRLANWLLPKQGQPKKDQRSPMPPIQLRDTSLDRQWDELTRDIKAELSRYQ